MGSRSTKVACAVRVDVEAVASSVAPTQQNPRTNSDTNGPGPCQDLDFQPVQTTLSLPQCCDVIDPKTAIHQTTPSRRRYSEPTRTVTMATQSNTHGALTLEVFGSFLTERALMTIDNVGETFTNQDSVAPVQEEKEDPEGSEVQCIACCSHLPKEKDLRFAREVIKPCRSCNSAYCISCVKDMFLKACKDSARMPPRCCVQIHLHYVKPHLTTEEIVAYKLKYEEWSTPKPFYCPTPTCSSFIPERLLPQQSNKDRVDSGIGLLTPSQIQCPKCEGEICFDCRQAAHPGSLCANLDLGVDADTAALLRAWGYKRCPKCSQGLKRMYGCNHMECRCGAHFCWGCMKSRDECDGGCDEQDDDEGESDFEPDGPEPLAGEDSNPEGVRPEDTGASDAAVTGTTSLAIEQVTNNAFTTPLPTPRPRNLDGGSARYWEIEDLDFGAEPTDDVQDTAWNCEHDFEPYAITLTEAISTSSLAHEMECVRCWSAIKPDIEAQSGTKASLASIPRPRTPAIRGRGGRRARARGALAKLRPAAYQPPRGLARSDATIGTAPHLTARLPTGSLRSSVAQSGPMEGIQSGTGADFRAFGVGTKPRTAVSGSIVFGGLPTTYSVAHECTRCSLLVCRACADLILARQQADEETQEEMQPEEDTETEDEPRGCVEVPAPIGENEQPPLSPFE